MKDKIEKYFKSHPQLRILFFFDPDGEYMLDVDLFELEGIRVIKFANNAFTLKTLLYGKWKDEKVFLYFNQRHPRTQEEYRNFPLLGLLIANKELALDDVGSFMEEYGLQRYQKALVAKYIKELKYATVQEICRPVLKADRFDEPALIRGLVTSFLKFKQMESWPVLVGRMLSLILPDQEADLARFDKKITEYGLFDVIQRQIKETTGVNIKSLAEDEFANSLSSVFYNQITQTITSALDNDPYKSLKIKEMDLLIRLNQLLLDVERSPRVNEKFREALDLVSNRIKGDIIIKTYGIDASYAYYSKEMIWEILFQQQTNLTFHPQGVIKSLEEVSMQPDINLVISGCLNFMIQAAKMYGEINNISTYILNNPIEYLESYTNNWYLIDLFYRKTINAYNDLDTVEIPIRINIAEIYDNLNTAYENHLDILNREWLKCLAQNKFDYSTIKVAKQYDFYNTEIAPLDQKVVVIISDGLRYEVANELLSELHNDAKNTAVIRYQLASLPSKTSIGMANLLPGKVFSFNEGKIQIDDKSIEGLENRQQLIAAARPDSIAIQFSDLKSMSRDQMRELFKKPIIYIYHDVIDATGDKKPSERRTFNAVKEAINELKVLLPKIHHTYNVAKVLITADHGFLYNDREIKEKDKEEAASTDAIITHNRFEIVNKKIKYDLGYQILTLSYNKIQRQSQFNYSFIC